MNITIINTTFNGEQQQKNWLCAHDLMCLGGSYSSLFFAITNRSQFRFSFTPFSIWLKLILNYLAWMRYIWILNHWKNDGNVCIWMSMTQVPKSQHLHLLFFLILTDTCELTLGDASRCFSSDGIRIPSVYKKKSCESEWNCQTVCHWHGYWLFPCLALPHHLIYLFFCPTIFHFYWFIKWLVCVLHVLKLFDVYRRCIATFCYALFWRVSKQRISDDFLCTYKIRIIKSRYWCIGKRTCWVWIRNEKLADNRP